MSLMRGVTTSCACPPAAATATMESATNGGGDGGGDGDGEGDEEVSVGDEEEGRSLLESGNRIGNSSSSYLAAAVNVGGGGGDVIAAGGGDDDADAPAAQPIATSAPATAAAAAASKASSGMAAEFVADFRVLLRHPVYVMTLLGYVAYTAVIGVYAVWGPKAGRCKPHSPLTRGLKGPASGFECRLLERQCLKPILNSLF